MSGADETMGADDARCDDAAQKAAMTLSGAGETGAAKAAGSATDMSGGAEFESDMRQSDASATQEFEAGASEADAPEADDAGAGALAEVGADVAISAAEIRDAESAQTDGFVSDADRREAAEDPPVVAPAANVAPLAEANGAEGQTVDSPLAEPPPPPGEQVIRAVEALIFASTEPVSARTILGLLESRALIPEAVQDVGAYVRETLVALVARYDGRGVAPVEVAGGWQFRTAPDLAPMLTKVLAKPRRLQRGTMETLAIIAYHQPCTRAEIEEIRGVSLGQTVLDTLIEESLIAPRGRKEVPGRPVLWGTTADFLRHFGLTSLTALPRREELLGDMPTSPRLPATHNAPQNSADLLTHAAEGSEESSPLAEADMDGRSVPDDEAREPSGGGAGASEAPSEDED